MGINNPKDNGGQTGQLDRGPDRTAGPGTCRTPAGGRAGPPGNRIGSALATEMVIALTQLRSHARTHATQTQPKSISRFGGGLTTDSHPQPPILR